MTEYREYRGLHGERIRVPEHTIAAPLSLGRRGTFPFARVADTLIEKHDWFARFALRAGWIDEARKGMAEIPAISGQEAR